MARKNLLDGLMGPDAENAPSPDTTKTPRVDPARPRYASGAIGAVSESIAALKSRAVMDIEPTLIDAGGFADRIEHDDEDHARLMASLKEYGQQVPILVRPHPTDANRYQIVYGRRRVLALRDLGITAKAMVRDLDDRALVMAQGQENASRRDLSFIEKCNFARQMQDAEYDRKTICDALNLDKTMISRMLSVAETVPVAVIEAIGAAGSVGRDRWVKLATMLNKTDTDAEHVMDILAAHVTADTSDARFEVVYSYLENRASQVPVNKPLRRKPVRAQVIEIKSKNGISIGTAKHKPDAVTLTLPREGNGGFEDWLAENLSEIHRTWVNRDREE